MLRVISILIALLGFSAVSRAQEPSTAKPRKATAVILRDMRPSSFLDRQTGQPGGFGVDLLNALAKQIGVEITYVGVGGWDEVETALRNGTADVCPVFSVTEKRKEFSNFTETTETFGITINVRADSRDIQNLDDLKGRAVAVIKASQAYELLKNSRDVRLQEYDSFQTAIFDLLSGHVDAFVAPNYVVQGLARDAGLEGKIRVLSPPLKEIKRVIGVRKGQEALYQSLNEAVPAFVSSPEYQRLYLKWFGRPEPFWSAARVGILMGAVLLVAVIGMAAWRYTSLLRLNRHLTTTVADLRRTEEERSRLIAILEGTSDLVAIAAPDGNVTYMNAAGHRMLGWDRPEGLAGRSIPDAHPPWVWDLLRREALPAATEKGHWQGETAVLGRDGNEIPVSQMIVAHRSPGGEVDYLFTVMRDMTERKRAEDALRENEKRLREVQELARLGHWDWDVRSGDVRWSDQVYRIFDLDPREFNPRIDSILALSPWPEDHERDKELLQKAMASHEKGEYEQRFLRPDRSIGYYYSTFQGRYDEAGTLLSIFGTVIDITERKRAEQLIRDVNADLERRVEERTAQLAAANNALNEFAYVVSHDLKAPLRAVNQLAHWITEDYASALDEEGKRKLSLMNSRIARMHNLIDGILQYSRIGRVEEDRKPIDLDLLVRTAIEALAPPPNIRVGVESRLPTITADETRMEQVFQNLIGNAIKFMDKPEGLITVACEDAGGRWRFRVSDNGPGIDPKYHDKVFGIFQTLAPRDQQEGTGIGLALVKKIIEGYAGKVELASEIGRGCVFTFTLPK